MRLLLAALLVLLYIPSADAEELSAVGYWASNERGVIEIYNCPDSANNLCGRIANQGTRKDAENPDPALRDRPVSGLVIIEGMEAGNPGRWSGGTIYNINDGKTYRGKLKMQDNGNLKLSGCMLFICQGRVWTPLTPEQALARINRTRAENEAGN